ncbi:MAG TPA: caspase family protein [Thermoanaerobaculia bacterium]|jgi:WD40 repeat protein|nr:caspase family protein [Thermoanaerobaculia bacterium]
MKKISLVLVGAALFLARLGTAEDFGFVFTTRWALPAGPVHALAFSPDGHWFVAAAGERATVFDLGHDGSPKQRGELPGLRQETLGVVVSPDGRTIAVVDDGGALRLYASASLQLLAVVPKAHSGKALAVAFTGDGSYVVTGGHDGKVKVWTLKGEPFADLARGARHDGDVVMVAGLPPGRKVLSVGKDGKVILWQVDTQQALRPTEVNSGVRSAAMGGDGKTLALGLQLLTGNRFRSGHLGSLAHEIQTDDRVRLIDADNGTQLRDMEGERQDLDTVAVTPDGRFVASAGGGSSTAVWDAVTGKRINNIPADEPVTAIAFGPDGKWMLIGTKKASLSLYQLSGVGPGTRPVSPSPLIILIVDPAELPDEAAAARGPALRVETSTFRLRGRIKTSTPLKSLVVGGKEITSITRDDSGDYLWNAYVPLPAGRSAIEVVAEDQKGTIARRSYVVERAEKAPPPPVGKGRRIALIVGVSSYHNPGINLKYADADARALYDLITNPALGPAAFHPEDVRLLLNEHATVKDITTGLRQFLKQARENDFVLFFFAGHGAPDPDHLQDLYLLAHDTDPENIAGSGLLMRNVREAIAEIPARDVLIMTDACHSAGMAAPESVRSITINPIHQIFLDKMLHASGGLAILTASEAAQVSYENSRWGQHGVFTHFLLEGLKGAADADGDHVVTLGELMEYVREKVKEATRSKQIPAIGPHSFDRDTPLAVVEPKPQSSTSKPPRR